MEIESPTSPSPSLVGDFEPLLKLVEPLFSLKAIKDESSLVLTSNPISSLINVELSALRPPPPPFPKPPKASKTPKPKRARRTELEASTAAAAVANAANDPSGTSTRRSTAIAYVGRITESTSSQGRDAWEGELRICSDSGRGKATGSHPCLPSCHTKSVQSRSLVETSSVPEFRDPVDNQLIRSRSNFSIAVGSCRPTRSGGREYPQHHRLHLDLCPPRNLGLELRLRFYNHQRIRSD
ncbi:hypothetical protein F5878DRAFT_343170 [Lentinula raphanica]|uniref:Uncharacterized protein n=1 Tax=Lentinula raphanica TaxID=153919 RepID=A0AA38P296_9AGAR|nr:hypothetical protein F5878DRAFT_343170 [Lentinula raphanica]